MKLQRDIFVKPRRPTFPLLFFVKNTAKMMKMVNKILTNGLEVYCTAPILHKKSVLSWLNFF